MIFDAFENRQAYAFGPIWQSVMDYMAELGPNVEPGKHHVVGCDINIFVADTVPYAQGRYETHRRMTDVQMVLSGEEHFYYAPASRLSPAGDYDEERDVIFYHAPEKDHCRLTLSPGMFALVYPRDAHMPVIAVDGAPAKVLKAVAKIPLEFLLQGCNAS